MLDERRKRTAMRCVGADPDQFLDLGRRGGGAIERHRIDVRCDDLAGLVRRRSGENAQEARIRRLAPTAEALR